MWAVRKVDPEICHFHDFELVFAIPLLQALTRAKIIYDVHEAYPEMILDSTKVPKFLKPFAAAFARFLEDKLAARADFVVTTDPTTEKRFKMLNKKVATVYNYPILNLFQPNPKRIKILKRVYEKTTPIIYQGGMGESKGLFTMIQAMTFVVKRREDVVLLLVGPISGSNGRAERPG